MFWISTLPWLKLFVFAAFMALCISLINVAIDCKRATNKQDFWEDFFGVKEQQKSESRVQSESAK